MARRRKNVSNAKHQKTYQKKKRVAVGDAVYKAAERDKFKKRTARNKELLAQEVLDEMKKQKKVANRAAYIRRRIRFGLSLPAPEKYQQEVEEARVAEEKRTVIGMWQSYFKHKERAAKQIRSQLDEREQELEERERQMDERERELVKRERQAALREKQNDWEDKQRIQHNADLEAMRSVQARQEKDFVAERAREISRMQDLMAMTRERQARELQDMHEDAMAEHLRLRDSIDKDIDDVLPWITMPPLPAVEAM